MCSITVSTLFALLIQAFAKDFMVNQTGNFWGFMDNLVDKLIDSRIYDLSNRALMASFLRHADLDDTMLRKPTNVGVPPRTSLRALHALPRQQPGHPRQQSDHRDSVLPWSGYQAVQLTAQGAWPSRKPFVVMAETSKDSAVQQREKEPKQTMAQPQISAATTMAQPKEMQQNTKALIEDPELKAALDEMEKDGFSAVMKYYNDPKFLRIMDERLSDAVSDFCENTNAFWKRLVFPQIRDAVATRPAGTAGDGILDRLRATPETPGMPRPLWLTILGSVPTALGWYGYYKFCVEEELFQWEKSRGEKFKGCGGYGTLFPFVYGILIGGSLSLLRVPGGEAIVEAAGVWILLSQVNLYRRVNALCAEGRVLGKPSETLMEGSEPPLHAWWAFLPPPIDVVVGLRQVHFLSEYWRSVRRKDQSLESAKKAEVDNIAVKYFPFISAPRFTLRKFLRSPSMWFWFTSDWQDFDFPLLQESDAENATNVG